MSNSRKFRLFLLLFCGAILLGGCQAGGRALELVDPAATRVWPAPPEKARIKLLRSFAGGQDFVDKKTQKGRIIRWLTGDMAESVRFVAPYGVAVDGAGRIWVTDPGLKAIHSFDLNRRAARLWMLAGDAPFLAPTGICFDANRQRLYVADSAAKRVLVLGVDGSFVDELQPRQPFERPAGMALDAQGNLLVADVLGGKLRRFSPAGEELPAFGNPVAPSGKFHRPIGLAVDSAGLIYVIDSLNFQIVVLSPEGEHVATIGRLGDQPGTFSRPRGVAVDSFGHIYVADAAFDNIQIFNLQGQLLLVFGQGGESGLSLPAGLVSDSADRIYAVDSFNQRIQIYQFLGTDQ